MNGQDPIISYSQNMKLPEGGDLIGQTTGRGKDGKGRLIIYLGHSCLAEKAAQEKSGSSKGRWETTTYAIMGPAAKAIEDTVSTTPTKTSASKSAMSYNDAKQKSSEWTWLPRCFNIFKRTFLVKVGDNYYDMNASSLKKSLGISKEDIINAKDRDITALIKEKTRSTLQAEKKIDEILQGFSPSPNRLLTLETIRNPQVRQQIRAAYKEDSQNGVGNYLNSLPVGNDPVVTIKDLRVQNPDKSRQKIIDAALARHFFEEKIEYKRLDVCLRIENEQLKIPAIKDPEEAQRKSNEAIAAANSEIKKVNPKFAITTTSPKEGNNIAFTSVKKLREEEPSTQLDSNVFTIRRNFDVRKLIEEAKSLFSNKGILTTVQAASQYNAGEAPASFTPLIGAACVIGRQDNTQGPIVQTQAPKVFEITNTGANNGINSLASVINESTHNMANDPPLLENGYLTVKGDKDLTEAVTKDFCENGHKLQSVVQNIGEYNVVLSAAPSWQGSETSSYSDQAKDLAYAAAFYNYSALFEHALTQLKENPENKIHICPTAIGCGAFANDAPSVFKAFNKAANNFYQELDDEKKARVKVEMQIFDGRKPLTGIENLGIKEYPDN